MADPAAEVQPERAVHRAAVCPQPVPQAALPEQLLVNLVALAREGEPAHLDIAVGERHGTARL